MRCARMGSDEDWMRRAREHAIAEKGSDPADTPIAAILVLHGVKVARGVNHTKECCDATAHAEVPEDMQAND